MTPSPVTIFEGRHMISALMYISTNDGCMKTDLYKAVSNNPRMPDKLDDLMEAGLLTQGSGGANTVRLYLTDRGMRVAELFRNIEEELSRDIE